MEGIIVMKLPEALRYHEDGRALGKVVISIANNARGGD
jgi:hypothetical protein